MEGPVCEACAAAGRDVAEQPLCIHGATHVSDVATHGDHTACDGRPRRDVAHGRHVGGAQRQQERAREVVDAWSVEGVSRQEDGLDRRAVRTADARRGHGTRVGGHRG